RDDGDLALHVRPEDEVPAGDLAHGRDQRLDVGVLEVQRMATVGGGGMASLRLARGGLRVRARQRGGEGKRGTQGGAGDDQPGRTHRGGIPVAKGGHRRPTVTSVGLPLRSTVTRTERALPRPSTICRPRSTESTAMPLTAVTTSPCCRPTCSSRATSVPAARRTPASLPSDSTGTTCTRLRNA